MWVLVLLGCSSPDPALPPPPQLPRLVDPARWRFPDEAQAARYHQVRTELAERWRSGTHVPPTQRGNVIEEYWCGTSSPEDCRRRRVVGNELTVLTHQEFAVFGLVLWGRRRNSDLVFEFNWSIGGKSLTGDGFLARFDTPVGPLELSNELRYEVGSVTVQQVVAPPEEVASALWSSPLSLREFGDGALAALAAEVQTQLKTGQVYRCEPGVRPLNGGPPECNQVPLSEVEQEEERQRLEQWLEARRTLLADRSEELHHLVRDALPAALFASAPAH